MASDGNEETLDELDPATVQPVQIEQLKSISAECMSATSSSVLSLVEPAYISSYNGGNGNETNVDQVCNTYGFKIELEDDITYQRERSRYVERLKKGNRELKAMTMCYCCKKSKFSFVLACSHTACKACAKLEFCECKQSIGEPHACILASTNKIYWDNESKKDG